ncbi:DUF2634 domain-containing protein [uncultured Megasphaera sp.]|uniref:DUF2634 domain-containing protein n=1 Tax=uncultured Megasphaera sp. TaxID=165188 RepID=UPI002056A429|nr:DUF2634 domain-containing protein [uncultured Megasphaera sp.]DAQ39027.1 MAG TPA: Protein of unknown function (DUF2634) [Caudoviricetes sp.]
MSAGFPFTGATAAMAVTTNTNPADTLPIPKEWAWNFEVNRFIYDDRGNHVIVEKNEAIKVWIYKALSTERFQHLAYSWQYGIELKPFMGKVMSVQQRYSELKRVIIECLMVNPYIKSIDTIEISHEKDNVTVDIKLTTIYGEVNINV